MHCLRVRGEMGTGCRLERLWSSRLWKDWRESGAGGRRFHPETVRGNHVTVCSCEMYLSSPHQFHPPSSFCGLYKDTCICPRISSLQYCNSLLSACPKHLLEKWPKGQNSAANLVLKASKRSCFEPPQTYSLAAYPSTHRAEVITSLLVLFLWYSPCLSDWSSPCLLSIKTSSLVLWLKNSQVTTKTVIHCCFFCDALSVLYSLPQ